MRDISSKKELINIIKFLDKKEEDIRLTLDDREWSSLLKSKLANLLSQEEIY